MKIDGIDIRKYNAKQLTVDIQPPKIAVQNEWIDGAPVPLEFETFIKGGTLKLSILFRGDSRSQIVRNVSEFMALLTHGVVLQLDGYKGYFNGKLTDDTLAKTIVKTRYTLNLTFTGYMIDDEIKNTYVMVELTNQALAAAGTAYCDIEIRRAGNSEILSSASFTIEIEESMRDESAILSCNEISALDKKVQSYIDDLLRVKAQVLNTEEAFTIAESARARAESERINNEYERVQAEKERRAAEVTRQQTLTRYQNVIGETVAAADKANNAAERAETAIATQEQMNDTMERVEEVYADMREMDSGIYHNVDGGTPGSHDTLNCDGGTPFTHDEIKINCGTP